MSGLEDKSGGEAKGVKSKRSADKEDEVEGAKGKKTAGAPLERLTVRSSAALLIPWTCFRWTRMASPRSSRKVSVFFWASLAKRLDWGFGGLLTIPSTLANSVVERSELLLF